jgi:lipoate-protein ligase A
MDWRFIPLETVSAAWAMALEETLVEGISSGDPPTIRFWSWDPSAATVGRFQDVEREIDLPFCQAGGIDVVRRMSGGGAVFHDSRCELVYSLTAPEAGLPKDVVGAYRSVLGMVREGFSDLGIETVVKGDNNIMVGDAKISGNSQRRSRGVLQVHGTVLLDVDETTMFTVLMARPGTPKGRATPSTHHPVTSVNALTDRSFDEVYDAMRRSMLRGKAYSETSWTEMELTHAEDLVANKYTTSEWNLVL